MRTTLALTAALLALGACASPGTGATYGAELATLESECAARNGFLTPLGRSGTGRPATDYACTIRSETPNRAGQP